MVAVAVNCLLPLAAIEKVAGVTATDTTVAAVTVKVAAGDVIPPKVAVMAEVPAATPVARPVFNPTVATLWVPEAQAAEAVTSIGDPKLMVAVAVNCSVPLAAIANAAGVTAIDTTVAAVTVKVTAGEVCPAKVAVMVEVPAATPVARPVVDTTVATLGVPDFQIADAVTLMDEPSLYDAVATNCCVTPIAIVAGVGIDATEIDVNVAAVTVKVAAGEIIPPKVAVMAEVPAATPVARPFSPTVATAGVPEIQLADVVTSRDVPSLNVAVAINCWVPLIGTEAGVGAEVTATDVNVGKIVIPVNVELADTKVFMAEVRSVLTLVEFCIVVKADATVAPGVAAVAPGIAAIFAIYCEIVAKARA